MTIGNLFTALRQGYILKNPETWKNRTVAVNALMALLGVVLAVAKGAGYDIPVSDEVLGAVAAGIWGVVGMFNSWSTVATTAKIGVRSSAGSVGQDGNADSSGP